MNRPFQSWDSNPIDYNWEIAEDQLGKYRKQYGIMRKLKSRAEVVLDKIDAESSCR